MGVTIAMANARFILEDGIMAWFDGPEWNDVVAEVFSKYAPEVEADAQSNAPWEDRTGDARRGLTADAKELGGIVVLTLSHSVDYGKWLETIQNGRFAIIQDTLDKYQGRVFGDAAAAVRVARKGRNL